MRDLAIALALLIVVSACVVALMQRGATRFGDTRRPASSDDRLRKGAEQSGLLPTYGEDHR